jgi:hypothetical protein
MTSSRTHLALPGIALAFLLVLSGCTSYEPLVPDEVFAEISSDGREWTYDVAWQNTRMLSDSIDRGDFSDLTDQVVILTARLHRLETATPSALADRRTHQRLQTFSDHVATRSREDNLALLAASAAALQEYFDEGDFGMAKQHALEVLAIARWLDSSR